LGNDPTPVVKKPSEEGLKVENDADESGDQRRD
jgi:hypothetical protein